LPEARDGNQSEGGSGDVGSVNQLHHGNLTILINTRNLREATLVERTGGIQTPDTSLPTVTKRHEQGSVVDHVSGATGINEDSGRIQGGKSSKSEGRESEPAGSRRSSKGRGCLGTAWRSKVEVQDEA
jgi:hypothetical protein